MAGRRLARGDLCHKLVQILFPVCGVVAAEVEQIVQHEDPGRVHVVEHQPHAVISPTGSTSRMPSILLAGHCLALIRRMALHLRARALHPQIFGGQIRRLPLASKVDGQRLSVFVQTKFARACDRFLRRSWRFLDMPSPKRQTARRR